MKTNKEFVIEITENGEKKYFCINRFLGELNYSMTDEIEKATKLNENQIKYPFPFLKNKDYKVIKI